MTLALDLQKFAEKTKGRADAAVKKIVVDVSAELDKRSPVDTGRFRGNWQLGVGVKLQGVKQRTDKSGATTQAEIIAEIPADAAGKVYWLSNNLPYAQRLEDGYSMQAPHGMVGLAVVQFQSIVRNALEELR